MQLRNCYLALLLVLSSSALEFTIKDVGRKAKALHFEEQLLHHYNYRANDPIASILNVDEFFENHLLKFGLARDNIKLSQEHEIKSVGTTISHYNQFVKEILVFGGRLTVTSGRHGGVIRAVGEALLDDSGMEHLETIPFLSTTTALQSVSNYIMGKFGSKTPDMIDTKTELVYHRENLASDVIPGTPILAYHIEGKSSIVVGNKEQDVDYVAFVDAKTGEILSFSSKNEREQSKDAAKPRSTRSLRAASAASGRQLQGLSGSVTGNITNLSEFGVGNEIWIYDCTGKDSKATCSRSSTPPIIWRSSTGTWPSPYEDVNIVVASIVQFVRMMKSISGGSWVSHEQRRADLRVYIRMKAGSGKSFEPGTQSLFLETGVLADDCIAHEVMHGYTANSSKLVYKDESGALNEATSDIFGAVLDILNSQSHQTTIGDADYLNFQSPRQLVQSCTNVDWPNQNAEQVRLKNPGYFTDPLGMGTDPSQRWLMGRLSTHGAMRDMYYPECFGNAGNKGSSKYYCGAGDYGGVHYNSGVANRLFAVMVQGGIDKGVTLPALGMTKSASLMWNTLLAIGPATTFSQYANELAAQCSQSIGTAFYVPNFMTGQSVRDTNTVTQVDCNNLNLAIVASRMREVIDCNTIPTERPTVAPTRDGFLLLPAFSVSSTNNALSESNSVNVAVTICPGEMVQFSLCGEDNKCHASVQGDPFLRLFDGNTVLASKDDSCSLCPLLEYTVPASDPACRQLTLREGCYDSSACSGAVQMTKMMATAAPTAVPTRPPTVVPTRAPSIVSTRVPVALPTQSPVSEGEKWVMVTGLRQMANTASANNGNAQSFCFDLAVTTKVIARSYRNACYDTRVGSGDAYIRLRQGSVTGQIIGENDDDEYPTCTDSQLIMPVLQPGRYCFMMGCYDNGACSYEGTVTGLPIVATIAPTATPTALATSDEWVWTKETGVRQMTDTSSATNGNTQSYCFSIETTTTIIARSFNHICYDTRVGRGDSYIRLRKGSPTGMEVAANDDYQSPTCTDSLLIAKDLANGTYCLMMGCWGDSYCSYGGTVSGVPSSQGKPNNGDEGPAAQAWTRPTGLISMANTQSASNANAHTECFELTYAMMVTARSFSQTCGDTRVSGDSYIRLMKGSPFPYRNENKIAENDDVVSGMCSDSELMTVLSEPGQYCVMFGCYDKGSCSYRGEILAVPFTRSVDGSSNGVAKTPVIVGSSSKRDYVKEASIILNILLALLVLGYVVYLVYRKYWGGCDPDCMIETTRSSLTCDATIHRQNTSKGVLTRTMSMTDQLGGVKMGDLQVFVDKRLYRDLSFRSDTPSPDIQRKRSDTTLFFPAVEKVHPEEIIIKRQRSMV